MSAAVVARSWAEYLVGFLQSFAFLDNFDLKWLTKLPLPALGENYTCCPLSILIIGLCTLVLVTGVKESTRFNNAMTMLNLGVLAFVLLVGIGSDSVSAENLMPVFPQGVAGMAQGAGLVFFAFIGFDMVAALSEEVENPQRNMPIGIIGSLMATMTNYVTVSLVIVGMAPVELLGKDVPITNALLANACCEHYEQILDNAHQVCLSYACKPVLHWLLYSGSRLISFGAIFGLTTSTFTSLMGQPRIFYSMAQDGLLFKFYSRVDPETGVPIIGTIITGIFTSIVATLIDLESLANAISLGTLQVFTFVNAGLILLRMQPDFDPKPAHPAEIQLALSRTSTLKKKASDIMPSSRTVEDNGNSPIYLVATFTISSTLASMAMSLEWRAWFIAACGVAILSSAYGLHALPQTKPPSTFSCPMVPTIPMLGIFCNSYMMGSMPLQTWTLIGLWLLVGLIFYFLYGIHHSALKAPREKENAPLLTTVNTSSYDSTLHKLLP